MEEKEANSNRWERELFLFHNRWSGKFILDFVVYSEPLKGFMKKGNTRYFKRSLWILPWE
jgi:hypothetical protein